VETPNHGLNRAVAPRRGNVWLARSSAAEEDTMRGGILIIGSLFWDNSQCKVFGSGFGYLDYFGEMVECQVSKCSLPVPSTDGRRRRG